MTTTIFDLKEKNFSIVGADSRLTGDIYYSGHVRFYAAHEGKLQMSPESKLIIERRGSVSGDLHCHELEIHGIFKGVCRSSGRVIIFPGARVFGEIHAESIIVYPGAQIDMEGHTAQTIN
ncbi:MAG: polymer-forming cytoskeletal protein [Bacteriovoracales bacterium]|nr:polymer-forming cytoskeletal protein [Bacteriovoracales bacterium]